MGDGAEEREREIFVEKHFLIGRMRGSGLIEFPFISAPFTDSISNISKAEGGGRRKVKSVGRTLEGRIEGIRLPMAVVYFYV